MQLRNTHTHTIASMHFAAVWVCVSSRVRAPDYYAHMSQLVVEEQIAVILNLCMCVHLWGRRGGARERVTLAYC